MPSGPPPRAARPVTLVIRANAPRGSSPEKGVLQSVCPTGKVETARGALFEFIEAGACNAFNISGMGGGSATALVPSWIGTLLTRRPSPSSVTSGTLLILRCDKDLRYLSQVVSKLSRWPLCTPRPCAPLLRSQSSLICRDRGV